MSNDINKKIQKEFNKLIIDLGLNNVDAREIRAMYEFFQEGFHFGVVTATQQFITAKKQDQILADDEMIH